MARFTDPLVVQKVIYTEEKKFLFWTRTVKKHRWKVFKPFRYHIGSKDSNDIVYIPIDYESDLASVPRWFWRVFPPDGVYAQAAVVHDYLCDHPEGRSQESIDLTFLEAMGVLGVPDWKRKTMYRGVKAFQKQKSRKAQTDYSKPLS